MKVSILDYGHRFLIMITSSIVISINHKGGIILPQISKDSIFPEMENLDLWGTSVKMRHRGSAIIVRMVFVSCHNHL